MKSISKVIFVFALALVFAGSIQAQSTRYTIQLEAAPTLAEAEVRINQLKTKDVLAYIVKSQVPGKGTFYRVRVGLYPNMNLAKQAGNDLQHRGIVPGFFVAVYEQTAESVAATSTTSKPHKPVTLQPVTPSVKEPAPQTTAPIQSAVQPSVTATSQPMQKQPDQKQTAQKQPAQKAFTKESNPIVPAVRGNVPETAIGGVPAATMPAPTRPSVPAATTPASTRPSVPAGFKRFEDPAFGYSFDYPNYWTGQQLNSKEASDQRVNSGALFKSNEDGAFLNAIWNRLDKANNPENDNDLIVEIILKSMGSGDGTQLKELSRRVVNENNSVKTFIDLQATFQSPGQTTPQAVSQSSPIDFLGKAVIVRASKGILLVVAFYSKNAPSNSASIAERIIASVRAPE